MENKMDAQVEKLVDRLGGVERNVADVHGRLLYYDQLFVPPLLPKPVSAVTALWEILPVNQQRLCHEEEPAGWMPIKEMP